MGFYYIYNAIRGEADPPRYSPKGPNGRPPRTNQDTNASQWPTAGDFWKDYYATGFNTFTLGWMGSAWLEGYGQMLDYLQIELGTGIMPILNVGNTQEVINAHPPKWTAPASRPNARASLRSTEDGAPPSAAVVQAKANAAGSMARTFANASILAYYIFDEVGPGSMVVDGAVTSAVRGNDSYHPTFSLVCGVQCAGSADSLNARRYAERHQVSAIDSYTEYMRNVSVSPRFIAQDSKSTCHTGRIFLCILLELTTQRRLQLKWLGQLRQLVSQSLLCFKRSSSLSWNASRRTLIDWQAVRSTARFCPPRLGAKPSWQ